MGEVCKSHLWTKRFRINYHFGVKKHIGKMHFGLVLHVFFSSLPQFRFDNKHINAIISHNFLSPYYVPHLFSHEKSKRERKKGQFIQKEDMAPEGVVTLKNVDTFELK